MSAIQRLRDLARSRWLDISRALLDDGILRRRAADQHGWGAALKDT